MKVKRFLAVVSFSMLISLYILMSMPRKLFCVSLALFTLFVIYHRFTRNKYTNALVLSVASALIALGLLTVFNHTTHAKFDVLANSENLNATGQVISHGTTGGAAYYTIKINSIDTEKYLPFCVNVYTDDILTPGDYVALLGDFSRLSPKGNYLYNYSNGVFGYFRAREIKVITGKVSVIKRFYYIKQYLTDTAKKLYDTGTIPVVMAMGLGDKSLLGQSLTGIISYTGIAHAFTVSGLHVGFIALAVSLVLSFMPFSKKIKNIIVSLFIFVFMGVIGFTPSVIRAGVLVICALLGRNFFLEVDNYTVLAVVILITLLFNPYSRVNRSLLLSYSAYFGVIYAAKYAVDKEYGAIKTSLIITCAAMVATRPVTSALGMSNTVFAPIFNLLLAPVIMVVCTLSFFTPVMRNIPVISSLINPVLVSVNKLLIRLILKVARFAASYLGFGLIDMGNRYIKAFVIILIICIAVSFVQFESVKKAKLFLLVVPLSLFLCYNLLITQIITITVFDSGSETSVAVSYRGENYLLLAENVSDDDLVYLMSDIGTDRFSCVYYFPKSEKDYKTDFSFADKTVLISEDGVYGNNLLTIDAYFPGRRMIYKIEISGVTIYLSHNKADISGERADFYFFGSDTPARINADNVFYYYPLLKKHTEMAEEYNAVELYDNLTVRINLITGKYEIVKDVKNFGYKL